MAPPSNGSNGPTVKELEKQARDLGVEGYSEMDKDALAEAVAEAIANPPATLENDGSDDSGRPPLRQVAEERATEGARVKEITTPKEGDA